MADFGPLKSLKLVSRKIWVTWNFHTVRYELVTNFCLLTWRLQTLLGTRRWKTWRLFWLREEDTNYWPFCSLRGDCFRPYFAPDDVRQWTNEGHCLASLWRLFQPQKNEQMKSISAANEWTNEGHFGREFERLTEYSFITKLKYISNFEPVFFCFYLAISAFQTLKVKTTMISRNLFVLQAFEELELMVLRDFSILEPLRDPNRWFHEIFHFWLTSIESLTEFFTFQAWPLKDWTWIDDFT